MKTLLLLTVSGFVFLAAPYDIARAAEPTQTTAVRPPVRLLPHPLRVLLLASGPSNDFQFCHGLCQQLTNRKWLEFTVRYQNSLAKDEPYPGLPAAIQILRFPDRLEADDARAFPDDRKANLGYYDLIVALDPDWTELSDAQQKLLAKWVEQGGGLIVAAGPAYTGQLARKETQEKLAAIRNLLPVVVAEDRKQLEQPRRLRFSQSVALPDFLRLDEHGDAPTAGWEEFHTSESSMVEAGKGALLRGFHRCQAVAEVKAGARVLATFADADFRTPDNQEQPYLVTATRGKGTGTVVYLGASETFRLRSCRIGYFERFWINLMLHAADGRTAAAAARKPVTLSAQELTFLWEDLASASPPQAYSAVWSLNRAPASATGMIRERIGQLPPFNLHERIAALLVELDSEKFPVRQKAQDELEKLGRLADPALRKQLQMKPSLEVRQRVEMLLERMTKLPPAPDEELRVRRALVVLEANATPEIRQLLSELAKGPRTHWLTQQARAALDRLAAK